MNMKFPFEVYRQTRKNILFYLEELTEEQINTIPAGFSNNIAWNLGHIVVTQQLLFYHNANVEMKVPSTWVEKYRKGTKPEVKMTMEEFEDIKSILVSSIDQAEKDYVDGVFKHYTPYSASYGVQINSIEDVIRFIYAHEGFHWGIIVALKKLV
jgi:hypothetical protein